MKRFPYLIVAALFFAAACTHVNVYPDGEQQRGATASAQKASDGAEEKKKDDDSFKPWEKTLEQTTAIDGFFTFHKKRDNTLYAEIRPDQLGQDFGLVMHYSRGVGQFNLHDGLPLSEMQLMQFRRVGDAVHLVHRNPRMTADEGSAMRASLDDNVGHSIAGVFKIESQHGESKHLLIDMTGFFASDYVDVARWMKYYFKNKPARFDKERSYVEHVMGFPKNVEIDAALGYLAPDYPPGGAAAVSDYRYIPIAVRYSLVALPEQPMRPRLADDRVGHFLDAVKDFSRDREYDPYVAFVNRWRLEPSDEAAFQRGELVEPKQPIVYYIDRSVPKRYRKYVKEGIEGWQKAFEQAGFKNAIIAREAPDDSTWSAEDARYSTVRWTAAHQMGYAIGPSQTDPRTGEILNADVLISSTFVRGWLSDYQEMAGPDAILETWRQGLDLHESLPPHLAERVCLAASGKAHQIGFQHTLLAAQGVIGAGDALPEEYLGDALRDLILHEIGHTLGLRHNFKGSAGVPNEKLHDTGFTQHHGVSLSVMDYNPVNVAVDPEAQGHYYNKEVGTYDMWAIQYAYMPVLAYTDAGTNGHSTAWTPEVELPELRKIAEQAADPLHVYNTDEDNWLGPYAVDPLTSAWELGGDPVQFARDRAAIVRRVTPRLEDRLVPQGAGYQRLRNATIGMLYERLYTMLPVTKTVGGLYFARDHKGDPNGRAPFTPVSAARQRAAVQLLVDEAFDADAFAFDAAMLNKLAPNRLSHWGTNRSIPVDFAAHGYVDLVHRVLLSELLHPARLHRMLNNELRTDAPYTAGELMQTLTRAVFSELDAGQAVPSVRRNLQRTYSDLLVRLLLDAPQWKRTTTNGTMLIPVPEHVRSLARLELSELSAQMGQALASASLDRDTRAHLTESKARIDRALDVSLNVPVK